MKVENSILDDRSPGSFIEYNSVLVHEYSHWLQHQGTTFGTFLSALKYTQESTALTFLREIPKPVMRRLWQRREKEAIPIVTIDSISQYFKPQSYLANTDDLNIFGQIWFDSQWVYSFMNDCNTIANPSGQIFGDTISDVFLHSYFYNDRLSSSEITEMRQWYSFDDKEIRIIRFRNQFITSKLLMECQATLSELQLMIKYSFSFSKLYSFEKYFIRRLDSLSNTSYGLPLEIFHSLLHLNPASNFSLIEIDRICTTVNILINIALNPPLPLFNLGPPTNARSWQWQDIYPPLRFIRAIEAVKKIGMIEYMPTHAQTKEFINKIVFVSQIPTVIENDFKESKIFRKIDFSDKSLLMTENMFDSHDYLYWVQKKLAKLRENSINFLTNFANCQFGETSTELLNIIFDNSPIQFIKPPFYWLSNDRMASEDNAKFHNGLLRRVALNYCLFDAIVGIGDFDLQEFPPEISMSENFKGYVKINMYNLIVDTYNT
ncbi:hypothetical protein [Spirosoma sp. KNUC1025]|uniref:hypothetical protein n=1 Tax=Spirosoma sp. KNUC1025 TaxID=2894082 RepID=UPI0038654091|nr:hypothetical protein LN737_01120 [Spirosoma sp. KNUC1025]